MTDATLLIELGGILFVLALLARAARRSGFSPIPLYLLAGLAFGDGGLLPLPASRAFVMTAADIGAILLLLLLGLEHRATDFVRSFRSSAPAGALDLALNFPPGLLVGRMLGWSWTASVLLGGVTYITSSGVMSKLLGDFGLGGSPESKVLVSIAVIEDFVMALYLPIVTAVIVGTNLRQDLLTAVAAAVAVALLLAAAIRFERQLSRAVFSKSREGLLLTILGLTLFVAGVAEFVHLSAAVGAFLVGLALSDPDQDRATALLSPLRDVFAAAFFVLFGLETDPALLGPVLVPAAALAIVTASTKYFTGWWAAKRASLGADERRRTGVLLVARGEFSIIIAGLAISSGVEPRLGALTAAYVMILAVVGPVLAKFA